MELSVWNESEIKEEFANCQSVSELIREVEGRMWKRGLVVCGIRINDMNFTESDEKRFAQDGLNGIRKVEITLQEPAALVTESIESVMSMIASLQKATIDAAHFFRSLQIRSGQGLLTEILDSCHWMTDSLHLLSEGAKRWHEFTWDEGQWSSAEGEFRRVISEILAAMEAKDHVLVADLLEYDFHNSLGKWQELLSSHD